MEEIQPSTTNGGLGEENKSIYGDPSGDDRGLVKDIDAARQLAYADDKGGIDARLILEKRLDREAKTGLSEEQEKNLKLIDTINKNYPDSLMEFTDKEGRKVYVLEGRDYSEFDHNSDEQREEEHFSHTTTVITQGGFFSTSNFELKGRDSMNRLIDWSRFSGVVSKLEEESRGDSSKMESFGIKLNDLKLDSYSDVQFNRPLFFQKIHTEKEGEVLQLKKRLVVAQEVGSKKREEQARLDLTISTDQAMHILSGG